MPAAIKALSVNTASGITTLYTVPVGRVAKVMVCHAAVAYYLGSPSALSIGNSFILVASLSGHNVQINPPPTSGAGAVFSSSPPFEIFLSAGSTIVAENYVKANIGIIEELAS